MPVTVIVGGQFGSEGKGKVAHFLAKESKARVAVRVGGSNSGHTVIDSFGSPIIFQHLPTAAILPDVSCVLGAGSYIDLDILFNEISRVRLPSERLIMDPNAMIISINDIKEEQNSSLRENIGSTSSGTGAALRRRILRDKSVRLAKNEESLRQFVQPVIPFLRECLARGERVIIEGTQGFGLSLLHSDYYPFVTSRDTTAAAFISEVGLSPLDVDDIVLVIRAFPIRVGGNSGPLPSEIDWETVTHESGATIRLIEYTSVTKVKRRVARFDPAIVCQAILTNQPTRIVLNHLDYIDIACRRSRKITDKASFFVRNIETLIERKIDYLGFGPEILVANSHILNSKKYKISRAKELQE
jgi:adenylosuccinate synthase